jgi:PRTRC genetic system protein C
MALQVTNLQRVFTYKKDGKDISLPDPNPDFSAEEVMKFYAGSYPELTNGFVEGPKVEGDKASYSITTKAGKLG